VCVCVEYFGELVVILLNVSVILVRYHGSWKHGILGRFGCQSP